MNLRNVDAWIMAAKSGHPVGITPLSVSVFSNAPIRQDLIRRAIVYEESWREQGTESTKNLGQVRGSTRKPFPQKGRGKARVGTLRAPQFRGGYNVHGPRPHLKTKDIQRKVYDAAIRAALSAKFLQSQVVIVDSLSLENDKKNTLSALLKSLNLEGRKCYLIYGNSEPEKALTRASNKFDSKHPSDDSPFGERPLLVSSARNISCTPLMEYDVIIMDKEAISVIESKFQTE